MVDWAGGLADNLLADVFERLPAADSARFRAVCTSWNSAPATGGGRRLRRAPPELPWLLLAPGGAKEAFRFVRPFSHKAGPLTVHCYSWPPASEFRWTTCVGSSPDGRWLAVLDPGGRMHALDPMTGSRALLPPLPSPTSSSRGGRAPVTELRRVAVSSSGAADAVVVMATFVERFPEHSIPRMRLAVVRAGDEVWTLLDAAPIEQISDAVFHGGNFYAVSFGDTRVLVCDVGWGEGEGPPTAPKVEVVQPEWAARLPGWLPELPGTLPVLPFLGSGHLVGLSTGELALVQFHPSDDGEGLQFYVLKLLLMPDGGGGMRWVEVGSLGDDVLLLSSRCSMAMSTREFPELRRNCIYCVWYDSGSRAHKMQVHSLEGGDSEVLHICNEELASSRHHPVTWFVPNKA